MPHKNEFMSYVVPSFFVPKRLTTRIAILIRYKCIYGNLVCSHGSEILFNSQVHNIVLLRKPDKLSMSEHELALNSISVITNKNDKLK